MRLPPEIRPVCRPEDTGDVRVLAAELTAGPARMGALEGVLDAGERARADRFRFARDRRRYVVARGLLRELLAGCSGLDPEEIRFRVGSHGKPAWGGDGSAATAVRFNVSHSGDRALFALGEDGRELGVDLESAARLGDARDLPALAARTLTPADLARWRELPASERVGAFLRAWTRLEAYGKATGQGLGHVLSTVGVTFGVGEPARLLGPAAATAANGWRLFDLPVGEGWAGAVVVGSPP